MLSYLVVALYNSNIVAYSGCTRPIYGYFTKKNLAFRNVCKDISDYIAEIYLNNTKV